MAKELTSQDLSPEALAPIDRGTTLLDRYQQHSEISMAAKVSVSWQGSSNLGLRRFLKESCIVHIIDLWIFCKLI